MEPPGIGRGDSRFNLGYSMNLLSGGETSPEIYGNPGGGGGRPSTSLQQLSPRHTMVPSGCGGGVVVGRGIKSDVCSYDDRVLSGMVDSCGGSNTASGGGGGGGDIAEDTYGSLQPKKSPPSNGKKTKGRVKIKMEYIENKLRRYTTFSKRKTGIMKKAYELSTLTGTQVMLLVASETGHVYTFATRKLQPMITSEAGKALIQTCLNSPDPPGGSGSAPGGDQRMSATGFEETELTYNISDDDTTSKDDNMSGVDSSADGSDSESELPNDHPDQKPSSSHNTLTSLPQHLTIKQSSSPPALSSLSSSSSSTPSSTSNLILNNPTSIITTSSSAVLSSSSTPMLYQTPEGMVYTTPNGTAGVLLSVSGNHPNGPNASSAGHHGPPHFIAIPLSMMAAAAAANGNHLTQISGQGSTGGELDLSKRK